jgi:hypothetical protein
MSTLGQSAEGADRAAQKGADLLPLGRSPDRSMAVETASRAFAAVHPNLRLAMKLSAAHQPTGYVGRLQQRTLGRKWAAK